MQNYKKVLLFIAWLDFLALIVGCQNKILPTNYSTTHKYSHYSSHQEYKLKGKLFTNSCRKQRKDNMVPKESAKNQKKIQKDHINGQTKEVQERMKRSKQESDKINRRGKTIWEQFWLTLNHIF